MAAVRSIPKDTESGRHYTAIIGMTAGKVVTCLVLSYMLGVYLLASQPSGAVKLSAMSVATSAVNGSQCSCLCRTETST